MSASIERVLNNPYLLADIMRHVAQTDKAPNVLSTLCVSRAFRNPHVISEALRSITYIYKPLREKVTSDSVMSCVDIDHVSGAVERSELKIDGLLCDGVVLTDVWNGITSINLIIKDKRVEKVWFDSHLTKERRKKDDFYVTVLITQTAAHSIQVELCTEQNARDDYSHSICLIMNIIAIDRMMRKMNSSYFSSHCTCCRYIINLRPRSDLVTTYSV